MVNVPNIVTLKLRVIKRALFAISEKVAAQVTVVYSLILDDLETVMFRNCFCAFANYEPIRYKKLKN